MSHSDPTKESAPYQHPRHVVRLPIYLSVALAIGLMVGASFSERHADQDSVVENARKFREVLNYIDRLYVDSVDTDEIAEAAIEFMIKKLDPHSIYVPKENSKYELAHLKGGFEGVGISYYLYKDTLCVQQVMPDGPSEKAGLRQGDRIVTVDSVHFAGIALSNDYISDKLRGKRGSRVLVEVLRPGVDSVLHFEIIRDEIDTKDVSVAYMVDSRTGYLKLERFGLESDEEMRQALMQLKKEGMKQLIFDLRNNGGGYLSRAVDIADEFIGGKKLLVYTKSKRKSATNESFANIKGHFERGSMIVLLNENSASASEVVAGSLQDHDRALIVGRRSFGKGLVQQPIRLFDDSRMRLTISRYYTPSGRCIQRPYELGHKDEYYHQFKSRGASGEFFYADSIKIDDEDRYLTNKGRTVYGGGGITPDFFVPKDTIWEMEYFSQLMIHDVMVDYSIGYLLKNRQKLEQMGIKAFISEYQITAQMLSDLMEQAKKDFNLSPPDAAEMAILRPYLQTRLKAEIGHLIWDNAGFYPVFHERDHVFQQARQLFGEAEALLRG